MNRILYAAMEILPSALLLIPVYLILNQLKFRSGRKTFLCCILSLYLCAVYVLVGLPNVMYIRLELNLNLIPFRGMLADLKNSVLNVLLFVPLGILLPMIWEKYREGWNTALFGFGISLTIELAQILTLRATDVNDLITNTLGTVLGFALGSVLWKRHPAASRRDRGEPVLVCGITATVMFFLSPFLNTLVWKLAA